MATHAPGPTRFPSDEAIITFADHLDENKQFGAITSRDSSNALYSVHDIAHGYIGGTIALQHFSFHGP